MVEFSGLMVWGKEANDTRLAPWFDSMALTDGKNPVLGGEGPSTLSFHSQGRSNTKCHVLINAKGCGGWRRTIATGRPSAQQSPHPLVGYSRLSVLTKDTRTTTGTTASELVSPFKLMPHNQVIADIKIEVTDPGLMLLDHLSRQQPMPPTHHPETGEASVAKATCSRQHGAAMRFRKDTNSRVHLLPHSSGLERMGRRLGPARELICPSPGQYQAGYCQLFLLSLESRREAEPVQWLIGGILLNDMTLHCHLARMWQGSLNKIQGQRCPSEG